MLPCCVEKSTVAAESSARRGAGVSDRGGDGAVDHAAFEEASCEQSTQTAAVAFFVFVSFPGCRRSRSRAAAPGSDVAVNVRVRQVEGHVTLEVAVGEGNYLFGQSGRWV